MEFTITFIRLFFWSMYLVAPLLVFFALIITVLGLVACRIEKWSRFDGLYWAFITATTVGYGDIRPLKKLSKLLSVVIALVGMMFTGIIIAVAINTASFSLDKHGDKKILQVMKEKFSDDIP